ncbi:competence/damage-inducible protein A [Leadbetterella sp. DM7]|uniref:competence/damage-inducible protein A n=1 Tax=Leadbetterella sp. DM7 TaxID=3235085 RepID=UPI00349EDDD4
MNPVTAEIVTIGDEILYGQITDTNSQWMAEELSALGIKVTRTTSVADTAREIIFILDESLSRADIVLLTGGLGPTKDDVTKKTLCSYTEDVLAINTRAEAHIRHLFESRGLPFTEMNRQQAAVPSRCEYLHNAAGTAPGMWFNYRNKAIVSMAGVPSEMKYLMTHEVLPRIRERFKTPAITHRYIKTIGIGESFLAEKIAQWEDSLPSHIKLAYLPSVAEVKLRLTAFGENTTTELDQKTEEVLPLIREYVYATEDISFEEAIGKLLLEQGATLSTAESCTGGNIARKITEIAGSSDYFLGSVVSYANSAKLDILKVKSETLSNFGAVSEPTVIEMAEGVQRLTGSTYAVSTSGIAGPGGGTPEKPVGTIWMAATNGRETVTRKLNLGKDRLTNITYTTKAALNLLRLQLTGKWQK